MALEAHEPLWSMGDDTPTPGRARLDRPVADHLRQAFAQVTNPPIDPERERIVMDLRVEVGRRAALLGGPPRAAATLRLARPIVAGSRRPVCVARRRGPERATARWQVARRRWAAGPRHRARAARAGGGRAAERGTDVLVISDRGFDAERCRSRRSSPPGAVHTALTEAGLRGRTDLLVDAADLLDVHAVAMTLAVGATAVHPRLAIAAAAELAGTRGAEELTPADTVGNLMTAFEAGLRKTLARMGISAVASYVGGALIDTLDLAPEVVARCFPTAAAWPGRVTFAELADRQLRRRAAALAIPAPPPGRAALPDPGFARFRAMARRTCSHRDRRRDPGDRGHRRRPSPSRPSWGATGPRSAWSSADRAVPRDELRVRRPRPRPRSRRSSRRARSCAASSSRR